MKKTHLNQALSKSIRTKYVLSKNGATRFRNFQHWLLSANIPPEIHLFLSLFGFDGLRAADFKCAIQSSPVFYEIDSVGLGWIDENGRQQRIKLGAITLSLLAVTPWKKVQAISINALTEYYAYFFYGFESVLEKFSEDQKAWFCEIGSGPLVEHFIGGIQMTALSDACYARLISKQSLLLDNLETADHDGILYQSLEGWLEPKGNDDNPIFVDQIVQICRRCRIDDRHGYKSDLLRSCQEIFHDASNAGPVTSLILSWVVDLILYGTASKKDIAVATIVNYVGALAKPIFWLLKHQEFDQWEITKFEYEYSKLIFEASPGQKKNMVSAINTWHRFLVSWLDVPPLIKRLHDNVPLSVPSANVIWLHELQQIQDWLGQATMEKRLQIYLRAMFNIAFQIRLRINELLKLRMSDVQFFDDVIQISIRGTKSIAAKRRIEININDCKEFIDLLHYRQSEMALINDYLFADPNKVDRIFKLSRLYSCASYLIKAVTGDPSTRFHITSHTIISEILREKLLGGSDNLTNPLHQLATDFGHFSILTSCSEYMHRFEDDFRATIDRSLSRLEITSEIAARWTGKKPATIRKQVSLSKIAKNKVHWQTIFASSSCKSVNDVCQGLQLNNPIPPKFLNESYSVGLIKVLNVFSDIQKTIPIEVIALRQSLSHDDILKLLTNAKKIFLKSSVSSINFKSSPEQTIKIIQNANWLSFDKAVSDKYQNLLKAAQSENNLNAKQIDAWPILNKNGYLSLVNQVIVNDFLELLSMLNTPVTHLAIAHTNEINSQELRLIESIFYQKFGVTVPQFPVIKRGGRPPVYLMFSSQRISGNQFPAAAALSISGLNAILFAIAVLIEVNHEK